MTGPALLSARHDAESRLDSIEFHVQGLRSLLTGTAVLALSQPVTPPLSGPADDQDAAAQFEQTVLATFGAWVLKELRAEGLDVSAQVRQAHSMITDLLAAEERVIVPTESSLGIQPEPIEELFSSEDLESRDEDLDVDPVDISRN